MRKRKKFRLKNIRKLLCFCFPTGKRALPNDWECLENGQYCCFSEITSNDLRNCVLDTLEALCQEEIVSEDKEKTNRPRQWVPRLGVNTSRIQFPNGKRSAPNDSDSLDDEQYSCFSETCSNDGKNHLVETLAALCQQVIVSEATENAYCSGPWIPRRRSLEFSINAIDPAAVLIFIPHDVLVPRPLWTYPMYQQYDFPDSIITCPRNACRTVSCLYGLSPSAWYLALCLWHHYTTSFSQIKACRHSTDICLSALSVLNMFMSIVCQMDDSKVVKTTVSEGQAILEITITTSPTHPELFKALFGRLYCFKNTVTHPLVQGVHGVVVQNIDIREDAYGDIHLHAIVYPAARQQSVMRRAVMPRFAVRKFALRRFVVRRSTVRRSTLRRRIQALPDVRETSIDIPRQHIENDRLNDVIRDHCLRYDIGDIGNDFDSQENTPDHSSNLETSLEIANVMNSIIDKIENHEIATDIFNLMNSIIDRIELQEIDVANTYNAIIDDNIDDVNIINSGNNDISNVDTAYNSNGQQNSTDSPYSLDYNDRIDGKNETSDASLINLEYDKANVTSQDGNDDDACNIIYQGTSEADDINDDSGTIGANKADVIADLSTCPNGNDGRANSSIDHADSPIHSCGFSSLVPQNSSSDVNNIEYDKTTVTSQETNNDDNCNVICQEASEADDNNDDSATINANKADVTVDLSTCSNVNDGRAYSNIDHTGFPVHPHSFSSLVPQNSSSDAVNIEYDKTAMTSHEANNDDDCQEANEEVSEEGEDNGDSATIKTNKADAIADLSTCPNVNDGRAYSSFDHADFPIHPHSFSSLVPHNSSSDVISLVTVMPARRAPLTKIHPKSMLQASSDPPPQIDHMNGVTSHAVARAQTSLNNALISDSFSPTKHENGQGKDTEIWTSRPYEETDNQPIPLGPRENDQGHVLVPKPCDKDAHKLSCDSSAETSPIFLSRIACPQITQNPASTAMHHSVAVCICGLAFAVVLDPGRWSVKKLTLLLTNAAGVEKAILQKNKKGNIDMCDLPAEVNTKFKSLPSGPRSVWLGTKHVISSSTVSSSSHPAHLRSASSHLLSALSLALTLCHNIGAVIVNDNGVHGVMLTKRKQVALLSSCCKEASMCIFNDLSECANYLQRKFNTSVFQILPVYKYASCLQHSTRPGNHHKHVLRHQ